MIETQDGSFTLRNEQYDQPYHSKSGAYEEALEKHVVPGNVKNGSTILDFCFGLGYNSLVAIEKYDNLHITALELDEKVFVKCLEITFKDPIVHSLYQQMMGQIVQQVQMGHSDFEIIVKSSTVRVIVGDAAQTIKQLHANTFDVVFFDPFSPKAHPKLWEESVFSDCFRVMKKNGRLTTYSCARVVRDAMRVVGFEVVDGPVIGRRSPSTIAQKNTLSLSNVQ